MADYPGSVKSFTAVNDGDVVSDEMFEDAYAEITAIEQALLVDGLEHDLFPQSSSDARTLGTTAKAWGLSYLKGLHLSAATELTIASGAVTVSQGFHKIDTESDAASDDLDTVTAGTGIQEGFLLVLRAENVARVVTLKDGTGNLLLNGDCALNATDKLILLIYDGTNFREIARSAPSTSALANGSTTALSADSNGYLTSATQPRCVAYHSTTASITGGAAASALALDSEDVDVGAMHELVTNNSRVTVPASAGGYYDIHGQTFIATATTGTFELQIRVNGTVKRAFKVNQLNGAHTIQVSAKLVLSASDYVELYASQSTNTVTIGSTSVQDATRLTVTRIW